MDAARHRRRARASTSGIGLQINFGKIKATLKRDADEVE